MPASVKSIFKVFFAIGLLYWLVRSEVIDFNDLFQLLKQPLAVLLLALALGSILINHLRWLQLLKGQGLKFGFWSSAPLTFIGLFFNFAIPGGVGGDVVKTYYLVQSQARGKRLAAAVTVVWDRLIGLFSMLLVATGALALHSSIIAGHAEMRALATAVVSIVILFIISFIVLLYPPLYVIASRWAEPWPRMKDILYRLEESMGGIRNNPRSFVYCILLSWVSHGLAISFVLLAASISSPEPIQASIYFFMVPLVFVATAIPISPAGIGVGQAAIYFLFKAATGTESAVGPNAITAWQLAQLLWGLVGAYFYLRYKHQRGDVESGTVSAHQQQTQ